MSTIFMKRDIVYRKYRNAVEEKTEQLKSQSEMRAIIEMGRIARKERNARISKKVKAMIQSSIELAKKPVLGFRNQSSSVLGNKSINLSPKIMDSVVKRQLAASMR